MDFQQVQLQHVSASCDTKKFYVGKGHNTDGFDCSTTNLVIQNR